MPNKYEMFRQDRRVFRAGASSMLAEMRDMQARYKMGWARYFGDQKYARELEKTAIARQHDFDMMEKEAGFRAEAAELGHERLLERGEIGQEFAMERIEAGGIQQRETALFSERLGASMAEAERQRKLDRGRELGYGEQTAEEAMDRIDFANKQYARAVVAREYMSEQDQKQMIGEMLPAAKAAYPGAEIAFAGVQTLEEYQSAVKQAEAITKRRVEERHRLEAIASAKTDTLVEGVIATDAAKADARAQLDARNRQQGTPTGLEPGAPKRKILEAVAAANPGDDVPGVGKVGQEEIDTARQQLEELKAREALEPK